MTKIYDVTIIGGNLTGATAALALHQIGLEVALVEPNSVQTLANRDFTNQPFATRVSAIIPTAKKFLQHLDVWQDLPKERLQSVKNMQVGENGYFINFDYRQSLCKELADIVENDVLQSALWQKLTDACVDIFHTRMQNIKPPSKDNEALVVELEGQAPLASKLLIGADGMNSQVRQKMGILWGSKDYQQHCIVGNVKPHNSHQQTAWQSYHQGNPFAFLPHPDGSCSLAWYVKPSLAEKLLNSTDELQQALNNMVEKANLSQLGNISINQTLQAFPIRRGRARRSYAERILLIGDACRTIHPMAGQGVNLGILDVAVLQQELQMAKRQALSITHPLIIRRCARRRSDDRIVQYGMDFFDQFFKPSIFDKLRAKSLRLAEFPPIKQKLITFATGHHQNIPEYLTRFR